MNEVKDIPIQLNLLDWRQIRSKTTSYLQFDSARSTKFSFIHEPRPENELLQFLARHEIGLALEIPHALNRDLCRTNKLYTYPLAGCYTVAAQTKISKHFLDEFPDQRDN